MCSKGQKTGFFFDQRENRLTLKDYVRGRRTLDCFCYVGAWSLTAAKSGATEVIGLDSSEKAVSLATENAALNGLSAQFKIADVFDELRLLEKQQGTVRLHRPRPACVREKQGQGAGGPQRV